MLNVNKIVLNVTVKFKNNKVKIFKIDFKDLDLKLHDERYVKCFMADDWISDTSSLVKDK